MGGKSYYCDYCDCFMKNDINVRKSHNVGMAHSIAKANYLKRYKDAKQILAEESRKISCKRFINNEECSFEAFCRFSHYFPEQLAYLRWAVNRSEYREKDNENIKLPWTNSRIKKHPYEEIPSLQQIDVSKATLRCFQDQWG